MPEVPGQLQDKKAQRYNYTDNRSHRLPAYQGSAGQALQGCDIQYIDDRGFTPTVIQIVPLRGTIY